MARIAVPIEDFFEDVEYAEPARQFRKAGHELVHLGLKRGATVQGKQGKESVKVDREIKGASPEDYDVLFIPGGYSPDRLRSHEDAVAFVRDFVESGKPVLLICHAAQLLITADVLRGRKVTGWTSIRQDIINAGAQFVDAEVVTDGNLLSSRNPKDIPAFVKRALQMIEERVPA